MNGESRQSGVAIVEFTVALPLLLFLLMAGVELTRAFVQYHILTHAVRDGTRYLSRNALPGSSGTLQLPGNVIAQTQNLVAFGNTQGTGQPRLVDFAPGNVDVGAANALDVRVTAQYAYQPWLGVYIPHFGVGQGEPMTFTMQVRAEMRAIRG